MEDFFSQFISEINNEYSVIIEDDGRVAYAYLLKNENLVSDVWLYNREANPESVDWLNNEHMPFLNPKGYLKEDIILHPISSSKDIKTEWVFKSDIFAYVVIYVRGKPIAILDSESKPGWSFLVDKNGPLARIPRL